MYLALCPQGPVPSREAKRVAELIWSSRNALLETITIEREKGELGHTKTTDSWLQDVYPRFTRSKAL